MIPPEERGESELLTEHMQWAAARRERRARRRRIRVRIAVVIGVAVLVIVAGRAVIGLAPSLLSDDGSEGGTAAADDECDGPALRVYATPDLAEIISDLVPQYQRTSQRGCKAVQVIAESSADVVEHLSAGWDDRGDGPSPHVWIPEATSWVRLLEANEDVADLVPEENPSVAQSPTVVAMPRPMADAIGWPQAQMMWHDLASLVKERTGWSAYGQDEWGPFQFGMTNPRRSTAAMHTVISVGASLGRVWADQLSVEAVAQEQVRLNLLEFQRSLARTEESSFELLAGLRRADGAGQALEFLSAFPIDERQVWRYNSGLPPGTSHVVAAQTPPQVPLAAWYPADGNLVQDYPYVVLDAPWADDEIRAVADDFLAFLQAPDTQQHLLDLGFRGRDGTAGSVLDNAEGVLPERASLELPPPEPATVSQTLGVWNTISQLTSTLAVIDVSGSMLASVPGTDASRLQVAIDAAVEAVSLSVDDSGFGLWEFSTNLGPGAEGHRELIPMGPLGANVGNVTRREALTEALQQMEPEADTALYETALAAYQEAKRNYAPDRVNNVVLLSDGEQDNPGSGYTLDQLIADLEQEVDAQEPVGIIAIGFGEEADIDALERITETTGGQTYSAERAHEVERILLEALTG